MQPKGDIHLKPIIKVGEAAQGSNIIGLKMEELRGDVIHGNKIVLKTIVQKAIEPLHVSPYKFLSYYDISDANVFFGREALVQQIAGLVPQYKAIIINGKPGAGKSSLVNAGLIPFLTGQHEYAYLSFREYNDPVQQLKTYAVKEKILDSEESYEPGNLLTSIISTIESNVLIVFDQFERFFLNVSLEKRLAFIEEIKGCIDHHTVDQLNLLFVTRHEFYGRLLLDIENEIPSFKSALYRINLRPLNREEAASAIINPLAELKANIRFQSSFVEDILLDELVSENQMDNQGIYPPHLQIVCYQLYEAARAIHGLENPDVFSINQEFYESHQGAEKLIASYLEEALKEVGGNEARIQTVVSVLTLMTHPDNTRRFVSLSTVYNALPEIDQDEINLILDKLTNRRILEQRNQLDTLPDKLTYSLSHDFMVPEVRDMQDPRELTRLETRKMLLHSLVSYRESGALLNASQVKSVNGALLGELSQEEQHLLEASEAKNQADQRIRTVLKNTAIGASMAILGLLFWLGIQTVSMMEASRRTQVNSLSVLVEEQLRRGDFRTALLLSKFAYEYSERFNLPEQIKMRGLLFRSIQQTPDIMLYPTNMYNTLYGRSSEVPDSIFFMMNGDSLGPFVEGYDWTNGEIIGRKVYLEGYQDLHTYIPDQRILAITGNYSAEHSFGNSYLQLSKIEKPDTADHFIDYNYPIQKLVASPSGSFLLVATRDHLPEFGPLRNFIQFINLQDGFSRMEAIHFDNYIESVTWHPHESMVAVSERKDGLNYVLHFIDAESGETIEKKEYKGLRFVRFNNKGTQLVIGGDVRELDPDRLNYSCTWECDKGYVDIVSTKNLEVEHSYSYEYALRTSPSFSRNDSILAVVETGAGADQVHLIEPQTGVVYLDGVNTEMEIEHVEYSPSGSFLTLGGVIENDEWEAEGVIKFLYLHSGSGLGVFNYQFQVNGPVNFFTFSSGDAPYLAFTGSYGNGFVGLVSEVRDKVVSNLLPIDFSRPKVFYQNSSTDRLVLTEESDARIQVVRILEGADLYSKMMNYEIPLFSPDERILAAGSHLLDAQTGDTLKILERGIVRPGNSIFHPTHDLFAHSYSYNRSDSVIIEIFSLNDSENKFHQIPLSPLGFLSELNYDSAGQVLSTIQHKYLESDTSVIRITSFDALNKYQSIASHEFRKGLGLFGSNLTWTYSSQRSFIIVSDRAERRYELINLISGEKTVLPYEFPDEIPLQSLFSLDDRTLAVIVTDSLPSLSQEVFQNEASTGDQIEEARDEQGVGVLVDFVRFYDVEDKKVRPGSIQLNGYPTSFSYSPGVNNRAAIGSGAYRSFGGWLYLIDTNEDSLVISPINYPGKVRSVKFSPDGKVLAVEVQQVGSELGYIELRDGTTGELLEGPFWQDADLDRIIRFSDDSRYLVSAEYSDRATNTLMILDITQKKQIGANLEFNAAIADMEFKLKSDILAIYLEENNITSKTSEEQIRLIDLTTGIDLGGIHTSGDNYYGFVHSKTHDDLFLHGSTSTGFSFMQRFPLAIDNWLDDACQLANSNFSPAEWNQYFPGRGYTCICDHLYCPVYQD